MDGASAARAQCRISKHAMTQLISLAKLRVPLGGQEIELQQIDFDGGGMSLLRTRIREQSRFTVFDIDPVTAAQWGEALLAWARTQPQT
jgi:hypothetical protein